MLCPHCGKEHSEDERTCPTTGLPLGQHLVCPNCGQEARPGARHCAACGATLPRPQPPTQVNRPFKKKNDDSTTVPVTPSPRPSSPYSNQGVPRDTDPTIPVGSQRRLHPAESPDERNHRETPPSRTVIPTSPNPAQQWARQGRLPRLLGYGLLIVALTTGVAGLLFLWDQLSSQSVAVSSTTASLTVVAGLATHTLQATATSNTPSQILASATSRPVLAPHTELATPTTSPTLPAVPKLSPTPTSIASTGRLAFYSSRDERPGIYLMDIDNPDDLFAIPLPEGYDFATWPAFCGEQVVYEVQDRTLALPRWIYRYDLIDGSLQPIDPGGLQPLRLSTPACSPNGRFLAFSAYLDNDWELVVIWANTGEIVYRYKSPEYPWLGNAAWSQDQDTLWWMGTRTNGFYDINRVRNYLDSSSRQIRTFANGKYPAISPDGSRVAFFCGNLLYLCVAQVPSGEILFQLPISYFKLVDDLPVPATSSWSSDGYWLYFTSSVTGNWDIYRVRADGSQVQNLTESWRTDEYMPTAR